MDERFSGRFSRPSDIIDVKVLEHETRKLLFLGFIVAVAVHAAIGAYFIFRETEVRVVKPPTMELVVRRPRMTKPFEFKKQRIKKREYRKKAVATLTAPSFEIRVKSMADVSIGKITAYEYAVDMKLDANEYVFVPEGLDIDLNILRQPSRHISMKEEMITIDDLNIGKYKGLVIQDPNNKQDIKGFIYIATLWGTHLEPSYKRGIIHISDALNQYSRIRSKVDKHLHIDSRELFNTPFVYLSVTNKFELTGVEARNFGDYLRKGGFAVLENGTPEKSMCPAEASLRQMIRLSLGNDAVFLPIRNDHPLYHCFFDFDDGPPIGGELDIDSYIRGGGYHELKDQKPVYYLEGVWIKDRLVAIYSDKGYGRSWELDYENEPQLKMGVNMVVFALIQEGGIAERLMEQYTEKQ